MWNDIPLYVAIGFAAQLIDGAIGMAYGIAATTVLLNAGVLPAAASACVHAAEVFTTGASGLAHWRLGNVDPRLVRRLLVPGMAGGALGVCVVTSLPGERLRPWIGAYLLVMGLLILHKARRSATTTGPARVGVVAPVGFFGGLLDAIGGGGWGPIVTSTLLGNGAAPRTVIGSVNTVEFFVTTTITAAFAVTVGIALWPVVAGLVVGGLLAAPFAALATKHLPERLLLTLVGLAVVALSVRTILAAFAA